MKNKRKEEVSDSDNSDCANVSTNNSASPSKAHKKNKSPSKRLKLDDNFEENSVLNGTQIVNSNKPTVSSNDSSSEEGNNCNDKCNGEVVQSVTESPRKKLKGNETTDIVPIVVKSTFDVEELSPDDEIYTFQCPENYNKTELLNRSIHLEKLNQIINSKTNEVLQLEVLNSEKPFITVALPSKKRQGCLVNLPLRGHILVQKVIDKPINKSESLEDDSEEYIVKFPDNIKIRHPLLGADWKSHIDLADEAIQKYNFTKKKKKKVKKEKKEKEDKAIKLENSILTDVSHKKKKKKHEKCDD